MPTEQQAKFEPVINPLPRRPLAEGDQQVLHLDHTRWTGGDWPKMENDGDAGGPITEWPPFYHDGMRGLQDRFDGRRVADRLSERRRHYDFWPQDRVLIESAPFFFIATAFGPHVDCSMRAGVPGFVRIVGPGVVEWPEYDGNSMYRTLGNISRNPHVGLLFVKFDGVSYRARINGLASIIDDAATVASHHGAKLVVRVACELYTNCPRAVHDLANDRLSDYVPRPGHTPPPPDWKSRDYIRDVLPADDPQRAAVQAMPVLRE